MTVTAETLREKMPEIGSEYNRILPVIGKVVFMKKGEEVCAMYDHDEEIVTEGTFEEVSEYVEELTEVVPEEAEVVDPEPEVVEDSRTEGVEILLPDPPEQITETGTETGTESIDEKETEKLLREERKRVHTGVLTVPERRGKGTGPGSSYRARLFGMPITSMIRYLWSVNFTFDQIKGVMSHYFGVDGPQDTTLKLQRNALKRGDKEAPELTAEQEAEMETFRV